MIKPCRSIYRTLQGELPSSRGPTLAAPILRPPHILVLSSSGIQEPFHPSVKEPLPWGGTPLQYIKTQVYRQQEWALIQRPRSGA